MPNKQKPLLPADLPNQNGQRVVVRSTIDGSERRGIIGAKDTVNNKVRVDQGKGHFWQSTTANNVYIFSDNY